MVLKKEPFNILNKDGFFCLRQTAKTIKDKYGIDWFKEPCTIMITCERNRGKTRNPLLAMCEDCSEKERFVWGRLNKEQTKNFINDFNSRSELYGKYIIKKSNVYKARIVLQKDKEGYEFESVVTEGQPIGHIVDINNQINLKSVSGENIRYFILDEVIQDPPMKGLYQKFINLAKTFERFNKVSFLLIGNRDTPNNDFLVNWGIDPTREAPLFNRIERPTPRTFFIDMGTEQFAPLKEKYGTTMVEELAATNEQTDNYLNKGGFLKHFSMNILNYNKHIKSTFDPKFRLTFGEDEFVFGTFMKNDKQAACICLNSDALNKAEEENLSTIAIDPYGIFNYKSINIEKDEMQDLFEMVVYEIKRNNLYADNFDILEYLKKTIILNINFMRS